MDTKGLQKEFINWCKSKNKLPKSEDETKQLFVAFMKEKHPEEYKQAVQNQQKQQQAQAQKAAHGTKLNYFKSLKNQCAEDEEVVYFKKGGSVKCGCKKKEDGGEIAKAQKGSAVDKFKNRKKEIKQEPPKQDLAARDSIRINSVKGDTELEATRPGNYKPNPKYNPKDPNSRTHTWVPDRTKEPYNKDKKDKVKKDCGGSAIKKFKMHRQGGSLNGIPFMQNGTPKGGLPTAPKAEKRFKKNSYNTTKEGNRETTTITSQTPGYNRNWLYFRQPATIQRIIEGRDTAFVETPEHHILTKVLPRTALKSGNVYVEYNPKYDKNYSLHGQANNLFNYSIDPLEYEILKGRFNTALGK